jgi:hypothetical protein
MAALKNFRLNVPGDSPKPLEFRNHTIDVEMTSNSTPIHIARSSSPSNATNNSD